jgi:hypothetical protein
MEPVTKNLIIGAFVTAGVKLGLEAYYTYSGGQGKSLRGTFPYMEISPYLPPVDDFLASAGVPLLLYALGKGMKKERLVELSKGGAIYGTSELIGCTTYRLVNAAAGGPALAYVQMNRRM